MSRSIYHVSLAADWTAAQAAGEYTVSTRGRTLEQEGFLHASYADQVPGVLDRFYADVTEPMVLLVIDPDRLTVPLVPECPPGATGEGAQKFPRLYGPLDPAAVVEVLPLARSTAGWTAPVLGG